MVLSIIHNNLLLVINVHTKYFVFVSESWLGNEKFFHIIFEKINHFHEVHSPFHFIKLRRILRYSVLMLTNEWTGMYFYKHNWTRACSEYVDESFLSDHAFCSFVWIVTCWTTMTTSQLVVRIDHLIIQIKSYGIYQYYLPRTLDPDQYSTGPGKIINGIVAELSVSH